MLNQFHEIRRVNSLKQTLVGGGYLGDSVSILLE